MSSDNGLEFETDRPAESRIATFIRKLFAMLEESLHPEIFDWTEDGESIIIKKPTEFGQELLPKYFKHNRITSFIRQLNMYNFQKKRSRNAEHIYSHDLFKRGCKHLLIQIKRKVKDSFLPNGQPNLGLVDGNTDINVIVNENKMLKNLQDQTNNRISFLEKKLNELTSENQSLHMQVHQQRGKQNSMMEAFIQMRKDNSLAQPFMYDAEKVNEETQLGHKLFVSKNTILRNNSNAEPLQEGKIPSLQGVDTSALYGNIAEVNGKLQNQMRPPLKPILNNVAPYDAYYYAMGKEGDMLENYRNSMLADYNNMSLLGKKPAKFDDFESGDLTKRLMQNPMFGGESLNLAEMRKINRGFFSSIGDKEYENTFDNEIDLLCFQ